MIAPILKRYIFGLHSLAGNLTGYLPAQHLRAFMYKNVFQIRLARGSVIYGGLRFRGGRRIVIAEGTSIGSSVELDGRGGLQIGKSVNISSEAMLWTAQHDYRRADFRTNFAPITVADWVWIGPRVIVLPGVNIAEGCVIAAGSVLPKSTQPWGVYAGVPAKRIAERPANATGYELASAYVPFI